MRCSRLLAALAIALGVLEGLAISGGVGFLNSLRIRFPVVLFALFVLQGIARGRLVGLHHAGAYPVLAWLVCSLVLLFILTIQSESVGMALAATGLGFNVLTVLGNGFMPVETHSAVLAADTSFYAPANPGVVFRIAGDCLPFVAGSYRILLSVGDVLLVIGVIVYMTHAAATMSPAGIESRSNT